MNTAWVTIGAVIVGVVGQWGVTAFWSGRVVERVEGHTKRMDAQDERIDGIEGRVNDHAERISRLEGRHRGNG